MKVVNLPAIYEGGLRQAVLDYMSAPAETYESLLWRCGNKGENGGGNEEVFPRTVRPINLSLPLLKSAWQRPAVADIVHHHGCWSLTSMAALLLCKRRGLPLVYSPHGAFIPASLERHRAIKSIYLGLWERWVLQSVDCFHALSNVEAESIRQLVAGCPIAVIPNGIDLQQIPLREKRPGFWQRWRIPEESFKILFLSRIVADKGIDLLLRAMKEVLQQVPCAHCIVAGDGAENYTAQLQRIIQEAGLARAVTFVGRLEGDEKFSAYRNADIFVLPSRNEAQGIVVLEALSQNLPVVASCHTPYPELVEAGCGWWVDNSPEVLSATLSRAAKLEVQLLRLMGGKGRSFLQDRYSLARVHAELRELYAWLIAGSRLDEKPASIIL